MPRSPPSSSRSSPDMASDTPETRQMPSDTLTTRPVW